MSRPKRDLDTGGSPKSSAASAGAPNAANNLFSKLVSELDLSTDEQRALLRKALGTLGTGKVAHHLIPLEAIGKFKDLMQRAARGGFNINGKNNGIALIKDIEHFGGHPTYNQTVLEQLALIKSRAAQLSDCEIAELMQGVADKLREAITKTNFKPDF